ncbi:MAG: helix-turn-helix domain-containing protein [Gammaproteobacteria bacterium]|nr:helix-turn-helix domain-containing protein [Gammaproteobacteria bacterium]
MKAKAKSQTKSKTKLTLPGLAARRLSEARQSAGLSLRELAERAGTSHATLSAYEKGSKNPSVATFVRILSACGFEVDFGLRRRIRFAHGLERGEELAMALSLAEQFPSRLPRKMTYPRFGQ